MKFQGEIQVPAPREAVFDRINDPVFFASCIEGVQDMTEIDPDHFTATLETRIAYIKFKFAVTSRSSIANVRIVLLRAPREFRWHRRAAVVDIHRHADG